MSAKKEELEQIEFLTEICQSLKPQNILEIGSGWGISASTFMSCLPHAHLTTIDPRENLPEFNERTANFKDRITRILGRSGDNPKNPKYHSHNFRILEKFENKFDLIYIDGSHNYEDVKYDLENSIKLINKNGIIALDDYFHAHNFDGIYGVSKAVAEVCKKENLVFHVYPHAHGMVKIYF